MKTYLKPLFLFSSCTLGAILTLNAGAPAVVATDPVGYVSTTAADGSDSFIGAVLTEQVALESSASGVVGAEVSTAATLVADAYNNSHYVLFTTGTKAGQWYEVLDTTVSSVTLDTDVAALGVTSGDEFKVVEYWTLGALFPSTSGFAVSADPFAPVAEVLLNNLSGVGTNLSSAASYFYHDGSSPILGFTAGWYQSGTLTPSGSVRLSPETYFTVRNLSGSDFDVVVSGTVPVDTVGTTVISAVAAQDNQLVNPYPSALALDASGLTDVVNASSDPFTPGDQVILFASTGTTTNRSSLASYFYHDGTSPILGFTAGWYQVGSLTPSGAVEIPAGAAFWVRKDADATPEVVEWEPVIPYTL